MKKNKIFIGIIITIFLTFTLFLAPSIMIGAPLEDSILAQQILIDMLNGKLTGFIKLTVKPIVNNTPIQDTVWFIAIHNFTGQEHKYELSDRIIYEKFVKPGTYNIKVNRIPIGVTLKGKTKYRHIELYVHVATEKYSGGMYIVIEPDLPIKNVEVKVPLHMRRKVALANSSCNGVMSINNCPQDTYEVSQQVQLVSLKCGECHSISGIKVQWWIEKNTKMYFTHHSRDITYKWSDLGGPCYALLEKTDSGWYQSGKAPAESSRRDCVEQVNLGAVEVLANVSYKCERWYDSNFVGVNGEHYDYEYYVMTPIDLINLRRGEKIDCDQCGEKPPAGYIVLSEEFYDTDIEFETGDEGYWEWTSVSIGFSFSSGNTITFAGSISAVRKSIEAPYVRVIVQQWGNSQKEYYFWFENNTKDSHIVHLSWIPP
ncbi:MAG: hypothetical protein NDF54_01675 [archaeon GB-1867-035]|nr:hypothetical protein [Candidatus Culexmicrobium profundum]